MSELTIPWADLAPRLAAKHDEGRTLTELTDAVNLTYGTALSTQAVLYHLKPFLKATKPTRRTRTPEVSSNLTDGGYRLPLPRGGSRPERYSDAQVRAALMRARTHEGLRADEPLSMEAYIAYRKGRDAEVKAALPSMPAIRAMYGTWNKAMEAFDLPYAETRRVYKGLSTDDIFIHVAWFLRWMRHAQPGALATSGRYRMWAKLPQNEDMASWELVSTHGAWTNTVARAAEIERSHATLPAALPVQKVGSGKKALTTLDVWG